jgi:hypothetical protein
LQKADQICVTTSGVVKERQPCRAIGRRRINIVPFLKKPERPDPKLEERLKDEWPSPGIFVPGPTGREENPLSTSLLIKFTMRLRRLGEIGYGWARHAAAASEVLVTGLERQLCAH